MSYNTRGGRGGRGGYDRQDRYDDSRGQGSYRGDRRGGYNDRGRDSSRGDNDRYRGGYNQGGSSSNLPFRDGRGRGDGYRGRGGAHGAGRGGITQHRGGIYLGDKQASTPDTAVTQLEDALVVGTRGKNFEIDGQQMPGRPGYGKAGTPVTLYSNYVQIYTHVPGSKESVALYRYEVDFKPEQGSRAQKRQMMEFAIAHLSANYGLDTSITATDYSKILLTTKKLDIAGQSLVEKGVLLQPALAAPAPPGTPAPRTFDYRVIFKTSYSADQLQQHVSSSSAGATFNDAKDMVQLMNIIVLKKVNSTDEVLVTPQNKVFPFASHPGKEFIQLGGGLEALRGYFSSVRPAIGRILLNVNVCSGAFYQAVSVMNLLQDFRGRLNEIDGFIRKLKIIVQYKKSPKEQPFKTAYRTIWGLVPGNAKQVTFNYVDHNNTDSQPRLLSVFDYFKDIHHITLQWPDIPLLNVGNRDKPQYMPQELCSIKPGQQYRRMLSGDQTTAMLEFSARPPNVNAQSIAGDAQIPARGLRLLGLSDPTNPNVQDNNIHKFGLHAGTDLITVHGRVLQASKVRYDQRDAIPSNGSWNCANQRFFKAGGFRNWVVLNLATGNYENDIKELEKFLRNYGLRSDARLQTMDKSRDLRPLTMDNREFNKKLLEDAFRQFESRNVDFVLVILRESDKWLHACIKSLSETQFGILTQCTVASKFSKQQGQGMYMANLALKINMKFGGINHTVPNLLEKRLDGDTMLVGIDVTHPSPGSAKEAPSIACVVASVDKHCAQWPGSIRCQQSRQEIVASPTADATNADMVSNLTEMVVERLEMWRKTNKTLPNKLVVFRDGVSEGQYSLVLSFELPAFQAAFKKLYGAQDKWPKIAIIIVGKRHHTRFYPTDERSADSGGKRPNFNPLPGTVVDRGLGSRLLQSFFMQAHQGLQGTARPAHYIVIKDEIKFEADELQAFTHKLCYMFGRATKAVSVVPPVYYADLLAERAREYLFSTMSEGSLGSTRSGHTAEWNGKLHPRIGTTTWYV